MKRRQLPLIALLLFAFFVTTIRSSGQIRDVKWEPWQDHPCYKGISVSVLNMGYSKEAGGYLWGVGFKNNYAIPVSFEFFLTIGAERWKGSRSVFKLKPGKTFTDGGDVFTGNLYKTSSAEWNVEIGQVCFEGNTCGGANECYADCDAVQLKPNQPCAANGNASNNNKTSIETGIWSAYDGKLNIKLVKVDEGILFFNNNEDGYADIFKMISPGHYRKWYLDGDTSNHADIIFTGSKKMDYYIFNSFQRQYKFNTTFITERSDWVDDEYERIKRTIIKMDDGLFEFDDRIYFVYYYSKTGADQFKTKGGLAYEFINDDKLHFFTTKVPKGSYFHRVKKENKKSLSGKATASTEDCIWQSENNNQPFRIKKEGDVLLFGDVKGNFGAFDPRFGYSKVSEGVYQHVDGHSTWTINFLSSTRYRTSVNGSVSEYFNCISAMDNADEWVNVKDNYPIKLVMADGGVLCNVSGNIILYLPTSSNTYQWSDRPCNPDCYKTVIRFNGTNSLYVEYTNLSGQVNQAEEFVRKKK